MVWFGLHFRQEQHRDSVAISRDRSPRARPTDINTWVALNHAENRIKPFIQPSTLSQTTNFRLFRTERISRQF